MTPTEPRHVPAHRSPKVERRWVHSTRELYPSRVLATSNGPARAGTDFLKVSTPFIGIHALAPYGVSRPRLTPGPLTGFLNPSAVYARTRSTALFRAATGPGLSSDELSPRWDRAPLSEPPCFLEVPPPHAERESDSLITDGFPDSRAPNAIQRALAKFPRRL